MDTNEDMNIKIQNSGTDGTSNTKGSCRNLAEYLEHEDDERREQGKKIYPFTTPEGITVSKEEVIDKIDRNKKHLGKNDDKFLQLIVSPSPEEIMAMGSSEKEIYETGIHYLKLVSDAYAQNFHREGIADSEDLLIYVKPHFTRGDNDELQFHIHGIVSRKSKDGTKSLHPLTPHRNTEKGAVKGGFDRMAFYERCEKLFDQLVNYERKVAETFAYQNAMAHGNAQEKAEMAEKLAREQEEHMRTAITASFEKRRKHKKAQTEVEELEELLGKRDLGPLINRPSLSQTIDKAAITTDIVTVFEKSSNRLALELNLAAIGVTLRPQNGEDDGIADFRFSYKGQRFLASETMDELKLSSLFARWEKLTCQESVTNIRLRKAAELEEKQRKQAEKLTRNNTPHRGMRLRL